MGCCASTPKFEPTVPDNVVFSNNPWHTNRTRLLDEFKRLFPTISLEIRNITTDGTFERSGKGLPDAFIVYNQKHTVEYILTDRKNVKYTIGYPKTDSTISTTFISAPPHQSEPYEMQEHLFPSRIRDASRAIQEFHSQYLNYYKKLVRNSVSNTTSTKFREDELPLQYITRAFDTKVNLVTQRERRTSERQSNTSRNMSLADSTDSAESTDSADTFKPSLAIPKRSNSMQILSAASKTSLYAEECMQKRSPRLSVPPTFRRINRFSDTSPESTNILKLRNSAPAHVAI